MYNEYYGFKEKPFSLTTNSNFFYLSEQHKSALTYLKYGLMDRAGIILMTGDVGTGKTTIVEHVTSRLAALKSLVVIMVNNTSVIDVDILGLVNGELGITTESGSGSRIPALRALEQHLQSLQAKDKRVLLVIDEAQSLRDSQLEELRMLSNLQDEGGFLLQVMLSAQPELLNRLAGGAYSQITQRISVATELEHLDLLETVKYIKHRLAFVGWKRKEPLFTKEAYEILYKASKGIPRLINNLCNTALLYGLADESKTIDAGILMEVIKDRKKTGLPFAPDKPARSGYTSDSIHSDRIDTLERTVLRLGAALKKHMNSPTP
ncbi:MAG: AAA family ATPase [Proteobacteria bacterium]|nr:AAA family ATPase [Pseudomonadota bacterium]MBU1611638.1 AAA family ATPase [Pseudomonadota bacterium]